MHARLSSFPNISIDFLSSSVILRTPVLGTLSLTVVNCFRVFENDIIAISETKPYSVYHTQENRWGITFRRRLDCREKESPQVWIHLRAGQWPHPAPSPSSASWQHTHSTVSAPRPAPSPQASSVCRPAWWAPESEMLLSQQVPCSPLFCRLWETTGLIISNFLKLLNTVQNSPSSPSPTPALNH